MEGGYGLTGGWNDSLSDWQTGEHCEPRDGIHGTGENCEHEADATQSLWDFLNQDDTVLGLLGNQTPLPDCYDFFTDLGVGGITLDETLGLEESHKSKRRRTLEYPSEPTQPEVASHETGPPFVTSEVPEVSLPCIEEPQSLNCDMEYSTNNLVKSMSNEAPYMQEDNHLQHCSYGTPVYIEPDQVRESIAYIDDQTGISGTSEIAPMTESFIMQETGKLSKGNWRSTSIALKPSWEEGGVTVQDINQRINAPPKKASEILGTSLVAYPFTLIKRSWEEGDVTLQDINRRIHAPPKKAPEILGTSAMSVLRSYPV